MSHVSKIELEISSVEDLKAACQEIGLRFLENQRNYAWYGRFMDDYPLPEGVKVEDLGKCDHAIKVPGCTYEIGVIKKEDKYILMWDFWHSGGLTQKLGGKLKQAFATAKIKKEARMKGYRITQKKTEKGIRLVLTSA